LREIDSNNLVTQSNNLVEARYFLTKNEQLILYAMISFINPNDKDFITYKTSISGFARLLGLHKRTISKDIDDITSRLMTRFVKIETKDGWEKYTWVKTIKVNKEDDEIILRFNDDLKPYLLDLRKRFTSFKIKKIAFLKSIYAIRIYQLLVEYNNKKIPNFTYELEDFREMVLGEKSKKYSAFKDFRVRVLEGAQKELDIESDLTFSFKAVRVGRKIRKIEFQIIETTNDIKIIEDLEEVQDREKVDTPKVITQFEKLGIKKHVVIPYLERDGEEVLERTLQIFERDKKLGKIRDSEQGYLVALLSIGAGVLTEAEKREEEEKQRNQEQRINKERLEKEEEKKHSLQKDFIKQKKKEYLNTLSEEEKENLFEKVKQHYKNNSFIYKMIRDISSPAIQDDINKIIRSLPNFKEEEEEYIKENL